MVHVVSTTSDLAALTGGLTEFDVAADSVRKLIRAMDVRFPGLGEFVQRRMALAIDGEIHQDAFEEPLAPDSEVCLIPKIGGG
ncbi:MoaD/ThiS family protein [Phenylobacterium sp.]|jgi:molybdopterin converting factor small subunit|uniref:MoaD/ThiS family protein n=1 Tax=Phenylobacterium sp. TaxID=1871053 RepID=UPI002F40E7CD